MSQVESGGQGPWCNESSIPIGRVRLVGIALLTGKVYQAWVFSLKNLWFGMMGKFNSGRLKSR